MAANDPLAGGQWINNKWVPKPLTDLPSATTITDTATQAANAAKKPGMFRSMRDGFTAGVNAVNTPSAAVNAGRQGLRNVGDAAWWASQASKTGRLAPPASALGKRLEGVMTPGKGVSGVVNKVFNVAGAGIEGAKAYQDFSGGDNLGGSYHSLRSASHLAGMSGTPVGAVANAFNTGSWIGDSIGAALPEETRDAVGKATGLGIHGLGQAANRVVNAAQDFVAPGRLAGAWAASKLAGQPMQAPQKSAFGLDWGLSPDQAVQNDQATAKAAAMGSQPPPSPNLRNGAVGAGAAAAASQATAMDGGTASRNGPRDAHRTLLLPAAQGDSTGQPQASAARPTITVERDPRTGRMSFSGSNVGGDFTYAGDTRGLRGLRTDVPQGSLGNAPGADSSNPYTASGGNRVSTVPGFFQGGEDSAYARGERANQIYREMQAMRQQEMDKDAPAPGAYGFNTTNPALELSNRARGGGADGVSLTHVRGLVDDATRRDMARVQNATTLRGQDIQLGLGSAQNQLSLRGQDMEYASKRLGLEQARMQMQRQQYNDDRRFALDTDNAAHQQASQVQKDFMERAKMQFTFTGKDGKEQVNTQQLNNFLAQAHTQVADQIARLEAVPQDDKGYAQAQAQLASLRINPYQAIDTHTAVQNTKLQEVQRLARDHHGFFNNYVHSDNPQDYEIVGHSRNLLTPNQYVTRNGTKVPEYAVDTQADGAISQMWKPKRVDLDGTKVVRTPGPKAGGLNYSR